MTIHRALVTGASRGLGEAIARHLVASGISVILAARNESRLSALVDALGPERATALALDVDDPTAIAAAFGRLQDAGLTLDALINAAGISARAELHAEDAPDVWSRVLRTNLDGTFHVTRAALPLLSDGARIVNVSSDLGKTGMAAYSAYCASKHGVIGLTRALAHELAPRRITVNAICPGWVETDMAQQGFEEIAQAIAVPVDDVRQNEMMAVPLGRFARPDEVAALVGYLLSDGAAIMTGQALDLSGGSVMA
jgi:ketoreductase